MKNLECGSFNKDVDLIDATASLNMQIQYYPVKIDQLSESEPCVLTGLAQYAEKNYSTVTLA